VFRSEFCGVAFCFVYFAMEMTALVRPRGFQPRRLFNPKLAMHVDRDSGVVSRHFWINLSTLIQINRIKCKQTNRVVSSNPYGYSSYKFKQIVSIRMSIGDQNARQDARDRETYCGRV
jgi:hypothetical protein